MSETSTTSDADRFTNSQAINEQPGGFDPVRAALLILMLLAFVIRIFLLNGQSIWWDEGISLHLANSSLAEIVADRLDNIHPPLYFFFLKGWLALAGDTVFSARYLSVLAGWLQVAATYAVAARWFGRKTGLIAAFLAAISAVSVIYAQEIRVYSMLPLAYLALLALTRELTRSRQTSRGSWISWLALASISWLALHLHYVSIFIVGYCSVWALLSFGRSRRWPDFWRWILVQFAVVLASLPWFLPAFFNWSAINNEANAGTFVADPVPFRFLLSQVWSFHLTGLAGALSRPGIELFAGITAVVLVSLLLLRLIVRATRHDSAALLAHWLIPLSSALLVWLVRSFSHPRYVAMFAPGLLLLCAYLILPNVERFRTWSIDLVERLLSAFLLILLATLSLWGLATYFFDESAAKDDIRGAARYLETVAGPGDLILVPDTDWSLPYEYKGEATVAMAGSDAQQGIWDDLAGQTEGVEHVYALDYRRGTRDWQDIVPFALHSAGRQVSEVIIDELIVRGYELDRPVVNPDLTEQAVRFDNIALTGAWAEEGAHAGDAVAVAIEWAAGPGERPRMNAALRLLDVDGREISAKDALLIDAAGRPSDLWQQSGSVVTYHLLPLPAATPPLSYTVAVELYDLTSGEIQALDILDQMGAPQGQSFTLTGIETARAPEIAANDEIKLDESLLPSTVTLAPGLSLLDASVSRRTVLPGTPLRAQLLWQASSDLADIRPRLLLQQDETILAVNDAAPANGRYPTSLWSLGEQVLEERSIAVPPGSAGEAVLLLEIGEKQVILTTVEIEQQDHIFERPETDVDLNEQFGELARLAGYNLAGRSYSTAESIPLTLIWQSMVDGSEEDYAVFTHLLADDGRLIAQHDGVPGMGQRPLSGWVSGEYLIDRHELQFRDTDYEGPATIEIGLYDPANGRRVTLPGGGDSLILPVKLDIRSAE